MNNYNYKKIIHYIIRDVRLLGYHGALSCIPSGETIRILFEEKHEILLSFLLTKLNHTFIVECGGYPRIESLSLMNEKEFQLNIKW